VPGAHPHDPPLLAATVDPRMVRWWWSLRPEAPVVVATGGQVSAVSLPLAAGERALRELARNAEVDAAAAAASGPVVATRTRMVLLVRPYSLEQLGELLNGLEWVPSSVRFHGTGGYVVLPASGAGSEEVRWVVPPSPGPAGADDGAPWLPSAGALLAVLVAAGQAEPGGSRLAY
jgi:hypothetical protein